MSGVKRITGLDGPLPMETDRATFRTKALARSACGRDGFYKKSVRRGTGPRSSVWVVGSCTWANLCISYDAMMADQPADWRANNPLVPVSPCAPLRECDMGKPPPNRTAASLIWLNRSARIAVVTLDHSAGILTAMRWLVGPDGSVALDHGALTGEAAARDEWVKACRDIKPTEPVRGPDSLGRAARNRGGR